MPATSQEELWKAYLPRGEGTLSRSLRGSRHRPLQQSPAGLQHPVPRRIQPGRVPPARRGGSAASPITPASYGNERNELFSTTGLVAEGKYYFVRSPMELVGEKSAARKKFIATCADLGEKPQQLPLPLKKKGEREPSIQ